MRNTHPLALVAALAWPVLAASMSFGQMATTQPGVAPNANAAPPVVAAPAAQPAADLSTARIAVLPFASTNPQAAGGWIDKSIQQSLSADLLQVAPSRVQTSNAAVTTSADAAATGRQLGVNYVIFGSYSSTDSALRITGEVVDCSTGNAIGSLKATGKIGDVFVLEDSISHQVQSSIFGTSASATPQAPAPAANSGYGQNYYPPNGQTVAPQSSTGYATQDLDQYYQQQYTAAPTTGGYYSYPLYSYPSYSTSYYSTPYYSYPYYWGYPGIYLGFGFSNGHFFGGHDGHFHGGSGFHGGGGFGGGHGGGGHDGGGHR